MTTRPKSYESFEREGPLVHGSNESKSRLVFIVTNILLIIIIGLFAFSVYLSTTNASSLNSLTEDVCTAQTCGHSIPASKLELKYFYCRSTGSL